MYILVFRNTKYDYFMATVESLVDTAFHPRQLQVSAEAAVPENSDKHTVDRNAQRILQEASGQSVRNSFGEGLEVQGIVFKLMTLSAHRTRREHHMCAVVSYGDGKQMDINLPVGEMYTAESLKPHILRALRVTSIIEVFRSPVQVGQEYFTLCQLAVLSDTAVVLIAQSVGVGKVEITLPVAPSYTREQITQEISSLFKFSEK